MQKSMRRVSKIVILPRIHDLKDIDVDNRGYMIRYSG